MRIVAGTAKGRRLATPAGATRPTSDRAREALFSSLASLLDLDGARVLDLFAGTGAVGLEALSRGAGSAVLVESDPRAVAVLRRNVAAIAPQDAGVVRRTVAAFLADGSADRTDADEPETDGRFDLVFADPPYALTDDALAKVLSALVANGWLAPDAVVVVERSSRGSDVAWPDGITPLRSRRYGEGVLWYGRAR